MTAAKNESSIKMMNQDLIKLDQFDGNNFTRWKDKMIFLLTALKLYYILDPNTQPIPDPPESGADKFKEQRLQRAEDALMCRGHILHALSDRLYDFYKETKTATEIWNALEFKYKVQEEGTNKFLIAEYFDFRMIDTKPILDQIHALQTVVNNISSMNIILPEAFQVGAIIAKLPSSWKGYRKKLLHKAEDFSLEQIQKHLRIEEESRNRDKKGGNSFKTDVHNIESGFGSSSNCPNNKRKRNNKKKNDKCYNCGKKRALR
ncbi:uncharacterized protein LOC131323598 [Rhododendron vialii]|uniref:uncharacterized protein LOC131323598 n=1 Tax=Rhododendron vialii TaxID=182163 RepID=UPI00265EE6E8|nr:uncharacterized protein LOC131323598 [Rhododendron vialii]